MEVAVNDARPPCPQAAACMHGTVGPRVWSVIQQCWKTRPHERPNASHVVDELTRICNSNGGAEYGQMGEMTSDPFDCDLFEFVQDLLTFQFESNDF